MDLEPVYEGRAEENVYLTYDVVAYTPSLHRGIRPSIHYYQPVGRSHGISLRRYVLDP